MLAIRLAPVAFAGLPAFSFAAASAPAHAEVSLAGSMLQVVLALALVLGLIVGVAWLMRRFSLLPNAAGKQMRVVSGLMVGQRERVVLVEVRDQWLVLGVTAQNVNLLSTMPKPVDAEVPPAAPMPAFADWLSRALQKRGDKGPMQP